MQYEHEVKHLDFAFEKNYVVYKAPIFYLDVLEVNGTLIARYHIDDCMQEHQLDILEITFIQVPILKWSTRQLNIQGFGKDNDSEQQLKKIIISGKLKFENEMKLFIMVFNLETS
jgi:hypothetical protein